MVKRGISMLRLIDQSGEQMVCCCVDKGAPAVLAIGNDTDDATPAQGIVIDTTAPIQITSVKDAQALSAWLAAAAVWLRVRELNEDIYGD